MKQGIDLPDNAKKCIFELAQKHGIEKIVLFGSRARGDNRPRSDIDIAVSGGDADVFTAELDDTCDTLLIFDVVRLDTLKNAGLRDIINKEGVLIYEKA